MSGRPPPNIQGMVSLKIDNLSYRTDSETLRRKFGKYGEIGDVYIPKDRRSGGSLPHIYQSFISAEEYFLIISTKIPCSTLALVG